MSARTSARRLLEQYRSATETEPGRVKEQHLDAQAEQVVEATKRLGLGRVQVLRDPVGTGKTAVALATVGTMFQSGKADYALIVAPNGRVAHQWAERANQMLGGKVVRLSTDQRARWTQKRLSVVSAHSKAAVPQQPSPDPSRTVVIVDEAHRGMQVEDNDVYKRVAKIGSGAMILLVTATPFQLSAKGLGTMLTLDGTQVNLSPLTDYSKKLGNELKELAEDDVVDLASPELLRLHERAKAMLDRHLLPIGVKAPSHPKVRPRWIEMGSWATAYSVARVLPELVGTGKNDAYQGGLTSCSEALWSEEWVIGQVLSHLREDGPVEVRSLLERLDVALGRGSAHPKVRATVDWVRHQHGQGRHVVVFCRWRPSIVALRDALVAAGLDATDVEAPVKGRLKAKVVNRFRAEPGGQPMVLVLSDRFSESIDLDGGSPSMVHHDLSWNPVRLTQRWGRIVRLGTGFQRIKADRIFVPVLDVEVDRRLWFVNQARDRLAKFMVPADAVGNHDFARVGATADPSQT